MRLKAWRDRASQIEGSFQEGRMEGIAVGERKGRMEGFVKGKEETAKNALAKGLPVELIHEITGLDLETIKSLDEK